MERDVLASGEEEVFWKQMKFPAGCAKGGFPGEPVRMALQAFFTRRLGAYFQSN